MPSFPFTTFQDIHSLARNRPVVLFGAGNIAAKTIRRLPEKCSAILDNSPAMWGFKEAGLEIISPEFISRQSDNKPFIIICTTSFLEVGAQLATLGLSPNVDFVASPILNDLRIISELESHQAKLLFTSGSPPSNDPAWGGGVYRLTLDSDFSYEKIFSGNCHGLVHFNGNIIFVDDELGIVEATRNMEVIRSQKLPIGARGHGVAYDQQTECFFVAASYMDRVLKFDKDFNSIGEILVSTKFSRDGMAHHHCNDITVSGGSLYVSMFSRTGNWKQDVFDGAVIEYDIASGEPKGTVVDGLWMPHNISIVDGGLVVLDSLRGTLLRNNMSISGCFPGFTRGLAFDGKYFFVGQSRNRNYSKNIGISKNISIDASIIIFDDLTKVSRSLFLPNKVSEIHAILPI